MITGRDLTYGRALAIVNTEEYLDAVGDKIAIRTALRSNKEGVKILSSQYLPSI